ncbi:MAG: hypothetical protein A2104_02615 [Candidatus Melainabacteria bacterium GWF2_32_7]|nr:MAG: hypothetical protein A2104_02615 [Candidatus Melainabacteria bacterium GWF2_32_7]
MTMQYRPVATNTLPPMVKTFQQPIPSTFMYNPPKNPNLGMNTSTFRGPDVNDLDERVYKLEMALSSLINYYDRHTHYTDFNSNTITGQTRVLDRYY